MILHGWTYAYICIHGKAEMISSSLSQEITALHADICSALADPVRILILYALNEKPSNVSALAEELGITQSAASRHLNVLRDRGLVISQRDGQSVVNMLADPRVIQALDLLRAVLTSKLKNQAALAETIEPSETE
jgi:ArsR family transcriptional regulator